MDILNDAFLDEIKNVLKQQLKKDLKELSPDTLNSANQLISNISQNIFKIKLLHSNRKIDTETVNELISMQRDTAEMQLLTIQGINKIIAQNAMNAVERVITKAIIKAIGIAT